MTLWGPKPDTACSIWPISHQTKPFNKGSELRKGRLLFWKTPLRFCTHPSVFLTAIKSIHLLFMHQR